MKKILYISIIALLLCCVANAQLPQSAFNTPNQQLVELAVQKAVGLIRQEYQLEDTVTMRRYSWNHQPEFGKSTDICVKMQTGFITSDKILQPWNYDDKFNEYRDSIYRPVLSRTSYKFVTDSVWTHCSYAEPLETAVLTDEAWYDVVSPLFDYNGFGTDTSVGKKDGWIVLLTTMDAEAENPEISLITYRHAISTEADITQYEIPSPSTNRNVVGGIYITPHYPDIGVLEFQLVGIIIPVDTKWYMLRICDDSITEEDIDAPAESLTEIEPETSSEDVTDNAGKKKQKQKKH